MTSDRYHLDSSHGQQIPQGRPLASLLVSLLPRIEADARKQVRTGRRVSLAHWVEQIAGAANPLVLHYWLDGYRRRARSIAERVAAIQARKTRKSLIPGTSLEDAWDIFRPEVMAYIRQATHNFAQSTIDTVQHGITDIYDSVRRELGAGLIGGETTQEINRRMAKLFDDPYRAARIGQSEASRAMHAGQTIASQQSGVTTGMLWLASSDACNLCLSVNGKEVDFGEPFYVDPKGGPYAIIMHPPMHPHCFCTATDVIDPAAAERASLPQLRQMASLGRVASRSRGEGDVTRRLNLWTYGRGMR